MTITVTHSTAADGSFSATGATAWNASHTLSGTIDIANGGTGQATSTAAINALLPTQATNSGKYLTTDGTNTSWATAGGSPGGSTTQVQYNNAGSFAGSANLTFNGTTLTAASIAYKGATSGTVTLTAPAVAGSQSYVLPTADGTAGQVLKTDGAGNLSWTSTLPSSPPTSVEYLVVAGGGGGGCAIGGGGGAGGYREASSLGVSGSTNYTVTVGAGGSGSSSSSSKGSTGSNSVFSSITSNGGGGGGSNATPAGVNGGSGSGAAGSGTVGAGGTGNTPSTSPSQGNNGGNNAQAPSYPAGGGGGASAAGGNAVATPASTGVGGAGTASSITGSSVTRGGGGGGGYSDITGTAGSSGGAGGGGNGGATANAAGSLGTANTGGGGGGSGGGGSPGAGGNGGSGVVIIAYPDTYSALSSIGVGLTYDQPTRSGYRVYRFTAGTGTISW